MYTHHAALWRCLRGPKVSCLLKLKITGHFESCNMNDENQVLVLWKSSLPFELGHSLSCLHTLSHQNTSTQPGASGLVDEIDSDFWSNERELFWVQNIFLWLYNLIHAGWGKKPSTSTEVLSCHVCGIWKHVMIDWHFHFSTRNSGRCWPRLHFQKAFCELESYFTMIGRLKIHPHFEFLF